MSNNWKSKNRHKFLLQYHITDGYFICSICNVSEKQLRKYIENQG